MPTKKINPEHIAGLIAIYDACNGSIKGHVPISAIRKKLSNPYKQYCKIIIKYLKKHPDKLIHEHVGRNHSYGITLNGIQILKEKGIL